MIFEKRVLIPLGLLIVWQILDVAVHVAAQQAEPIRIASNAVLTAGALSAVLPTLSPSRFAIPLAVVVYLMLHVLFLSLNGFVNPTTEAPRLPLFVFVLGSLGLSQWLRQRVS
ncbi:hypothetical protein [Gymnodinialimonas hymeniacidonis]|uniref:hypothetical protein n=1 Tax=Gymnodinialimonas hymeniacidonis TaxID=3126508 RepID=UPI0034C5C183